MRFKYDIFREDAEEMFQIRFYQDKRGKIPVIDYITALKKQGGKDGRINAAKINDYIQVLQSVGIAAGEPYMKHLDGEIWELRPIRNRILFAARSGDTFILLHPFVKSTQKTPRREIEQAKRELKDYIERENENG